MNQGNSDIDFVVTWVDGNDPDWQKEKSSYLKMENEEAWSDWVAGGMRYRDWGLLKYWFRGVETCAPWVRKIHFVTWGHIPSWLDISNPKLNIVRHEDFIPIEYLPTFNSNTIELCMHRISGLSDKFVYFNDDMYLLKEQVKESFFKNGLPRDFAGLDLGTITRYNINYRPYNAMVINDHFSKNTVIKHNLSKWINFKYGLRCNFRTLLLMPWSQFSSIQRDHLPCNYLKSTLDEVWKVEHDELHQTCLHRFRGFKEVNHWLFRDWQRVTGKFIPIHPILNGVFSCGPSDDRALREKIYNIIINKKISMICLNDYCEDEKSSEIWVKTLTDAFEKRFPKRSSYELEGI